MCMFACVCMPISVYVCMCGFILRSRPFDCHSLSPCLQLTGTQTYTGVFVNLHVRFLSHSLNPALLSDFYHTHWTLFYCHISITLTKPCSTVRLAYSLSPSTLARQAGFTRSQLNLSPGSILPSSIQMWFSPTHQPFAPNSVLWGSYWLWFRWDHNEKLARSSA